MVGWAHYLSSVSMPWGSAAEISCVSAIYLALLVRLVVATVFSAMRVVLGLPVSHVESRHGQRALNLSASLG